VDIGSITTETGSTIDLTLGSLTSTNMTVNGNTTIIADLKNTINLSGALTINSSANLTIQIDGTSLTPGEYDFILFKSKKKTSNKVTIVINGTNYGYTVLTYFNNNNIHISVVAIVISETCFPAKTPIVTNQGLIDIENINPEIHTIRNKKIVAITKTISKDKYIIQIDKDAFGDNIPSIITKISKNHKLFYKGEMIKAKYFVKNFPNVKRIKYNGEVLYNVLMEEHEKMIVNNLVCETLHPDNSVAKLYRYLPKLSDEKQSEIIQAINSNLSSREKFKKL
jgi:hypothetical protein